MKPCLCYDASISSKQALDFTNLLSTNNFFELVVGTYLYDHRKTYFPLNYQVKSIEQDIFNKFPENLGHRKYIKPLQEGHNVYEEILIAYNIEKCNLFIFGYYGRKGQKNHPLELTTKIRKLIYDESYPLIIVRQNRIKENQPVSICYAYDGSNKSKQGLQQLYSKISGKNVKLTVLYAASKDQTKQPLLIRNDLRQFRNKNKSSLNFQTKIIQNVQSPRQSLAQYINNIKPDLVVVTRNGYRGQLTKKRFIGQTTFLLLTSTTSNIWIIN